MEKAIRTTAIIYIILSSIVTIGCFILGIAIESNNAEFTQFLKESFPYMFPASATLEEQNAVAKTVGALFIVLGFSLIAGIVTDFIILFKAKPETSVPSCVVFGAIAIITTQLVVGILFVIYATQKKPFKA